MAGLALCRFTRFPAHGITAELQPSAELQLVCA